MLVDTTYRSQAPEIMDDFAMEGEILQDALDKIASINKLLGGNKITIDGVRQLLGKSDSIEPIRILDIGCGNGDMLRTLAAYGKKNDLNFELVGIDANQFTINYATKLSLSYPNISYRCEDIFDQNAEQKQYDIVLCTLTLHHFKDEEIINLLKLFTKKASIGLVINDLHRSKTAYYLFSLLCVVFGLNQMSREDGLVSILRGFKKRDLYQYSKQLMLKKYRIQWKWAFRYQWIIQIK